MRLGAIYPRFSMEMLWALINSAKLGQHSAAGAQYSCGLVKRV